jgi:hypothetical protein
VLAGKKARAVLLLVRSFLRCRLSNHRC